MPKRHNCLPRSKLRVKDFTCLLLPGPNSFDEAPVSRHQPGIGAELREIAPTGRFQRASDDDLRLNDAE